MLFRSVRVRHTANTARVLVKDTGVGIPDAMQERIFERFAQADDTATRAQEGAGIGLALTKTLVDLHGGRIAVDSTEDAGTTFTVTVPRGAAHLNEEQIATSGERAEPSSESRTSASPVTSVPEANAPSARASDSPSLDASPPASSSATADTPLVLVVDDNADVRAYVRSILHPSFRIVEAATGAEGVQQAREHLPDVILADVMMPEMDGLTMTEQLRADPATEAIPIVMLTARAGTEDEIEGLSVGATDYVIKPFDPQVLEMRVRGTLAYQERLRRRLLHERRKANPEAPSGEASTEEPTFEDHVRAIITERLPDPNLNPDQLAEALAISRSTLYRRMKANDLPSPGDLIQEMRMTRAAHLLQNEAGTVSEIAYAVGFQSLSNFSKRFTQQFGEAPTAYASNDTASA